MRTGMQQMLSRPAVAEALGVVRSALPKLAGFPAPDAVIVGVRGARTFAWRPETAASRAQAHGRALHLPTPEADTEHDGGR